ncbi:MAG: acylphosphatase, partial [Desulfurococcales archaeon]|nr:acylphosphatase [Desulfurococcales archaeon]
MQKKAVRIRIIGLVQGVGFRPFIHRLAERHGLNGYVVNLGGSEVEVHVEGPSSSINSFLNQLVLMKPPPSVIKKVEVTEVPPKDYPGFKILPSRKTLTERSAIPPDFGICEDCLREILDPRNRRYGYPWNSCAWCGPRFSMIYRVPYDRENTSMNQFPLCNECLSEYRDLGNERRYHAQGISCQVCGPKTYLLDNRGYPINTKDPIREAARLLDKGRILAIKGVGGYHIASLATDDAVVSRVREIKQRPIQPLALMVRDCEKAEELVYLGDKDCTVLK